MQKGRTEGRSTHEWDFSLLMSLENSKNIRQTELVVVYAIASLT